MPNEFLSRRAFFGVLVAGAVSACSSGGTLTVHGGDDAAAGDTGALDDATGGGLQVFLGSVDATDAKVAFALENGRAFVFFCGGAMTYATHTKWFRGGIASLASPFTLSATGWTASGALQADGVTVKGTLDRGDGQLLTWSAASVPPDGAAGLYEATLPDGGILELIVSPASQGGGMQGAFKSRLGTIKQVVPLMPLSTGFLVQFVDDNGVTQQVTATRAHPT
jgi:hypothetical protein